jgi:hypothetical protein
LAGQPFYRPKHAPSARGLGRRRPHQSFAEGEGGSATGAVQWHQADSSTAPAANPTAKIQLAYVQAPFHASEDNGRANFFPSAQVWQAPPAEYRRGFRCAAGSGGTILPARLRVGRMDLTARWTSNPANR